MRLWIVLTSLLWCCSAFAQTSESAAKPEFEVASIKPSEPMPMGKMMVRMDSDAGMLRYNNVSLKDCIRAAYRVKDFQVQGPDWLGSDRFDIIAKLPAGASKDQVPEMLQALLADRFKLTLHKETKDHAVYALVTGKNGPKLKPAEVEARPRQNEGGMKAGPMQRNAMMMRVSPGGMHLKAPDADLSNLADMLSHFTERPVVDMTGIKGEYDFDMSFTPETMRGMPMMRGPMGPPPGGGPEHAPPDAEAQNNAPTIFEAVQQYGLKLEPRKAPLEMLIVDQIEKQPTEN